MARICGEQKSQNAYWDESILKDLLCMKINDEDKYMLLEKGVSDVLKGVASRNFLEASPQTPIFGTVKY